MGSRIVGVRRVLDRGVDRGTGSVTLPRSRGVPRKPPPPPSQPGPALAGDIEGDVAIIGAGFTGLTSAYFLKEAEPGLRVALLESDVVGFGASGGTRGVP